MQQKPNFMPDFFVKPWQLFVDKRVTPMTADVFAVIYWYEKMRDGVCTANNATIAKVLHRSDATSVSRSIATLIEAGYVVAEYDPETNLRTGMYTTLGYATVDPLQNSNPPLQSGQAPLGTAAKHNKKSIKKNSILSDDVEKLYHGWLIEFVINPTQGSRVWLEADESRRSALLESAARKVSLTPKRKQKLTSRLEELGFGTCAKAIRKAAMNPWNHGENPGKWKATIEWLFNSTEKVEEWANR